MFKDQLELMKLNYLQKNLLYDWFENTNQNLKKDDFLKIYIDFPREELIEKISKRAKQMIKFGAINEVKIFIKLKVKKIRASIKP